MKQNALLSQRQWGARVGTDPPGAGLKPSSRAGRASTAGGREPTASPVIAAISAKLRAGRPGKPRENQFELEGIPHPELFTPEQRHALRKLYSTHILPALHIGLMRPAAFILGNHADLSSSPSCLKGRIISSSCFCKLHQGWQ